MPDPTNGPNFNSALNIASLISAPLVAVSKAGVEMQKGQTRALLDNCFKIVNGAYEPIMIDMVISRQVEEPGPNGGPSVMRVYQMTFSVPLLSLVPMSHLAIDNVNIDFDMEITSVISKPNNKGVNRSQADLYGKISGDKKSQDDVNKRTSNGTLKISVHAGQLPLPPGVLTILDLYTKNMNPRTTQTNP